MVGDYDCQEGYCQAQKVQIEKIILLSWLVIINNWLSTNYRYNVKIKLLFVTNTWKYTLFGKKNQLFKKKTCSCIMKN